MVALGDTETPVGDVVGDASGDALLALGDVDGALVGTPVGMLAGERTGAAVVGTAVGELVGAPVGGNTGGRTGGSTGGNTGGKTVGASAGAGVLMDVGAPDARLRARRPSSCAPGSPKPASTANARPRSAARPPRGGKTEQCVRGGPGPPRAEQHTNTRLSVAPTECTNAFLTSFSEPQ